jgi:hypothetical protein
MRVTIMQPTYLPWAGYFDLMDQADCFVLLDDAQFVKQTWQQRNRIKTPKGLEWITVPVRITGRFGQRINEVELADSRFWMKHIKTLENNYRRAPFFAGLIDSLRSCYADAITSGRLAELNIQIIQWVARQLGITTRLTRSSLLDVDGSGSIRLVRICQALKASEYLSTAGASYLFEDESLFRNAAVNVRFHHYEHPGYAQLFPPFQPFAAILDVLFNIGPEAGDLVRSGRRATLTPDEMMQRRTRDSRGMDGDADDASTAPHYNPKEKAE